VKCKGFLEGILAHGEDQEEASELEKCAYLETAKQVCGLMQTWLQQPAGPRPGQQQPDERDTLESATLQDIIDKVSSLITRLSEQGTLLISATRKEVDELHKELARSIEERKARGQWEEEVLKDAVDRSAAELTEHLKKTLLQRHDERSMDAIFDQACFLGKFDEWLHFCFASEWPNPPDVAVISADIGELDGKMSIFTAFDKVCTKVLKARGTHSPKDLLREMYEDIYAIRPYLHRFLWQFFRHTDAEVASSYHWSQSQGTTTFITTELLSSLPPGEARQHLPGVVEEGYTELHQAASNGDLEKVKRLLGESQADLNRQDSNGDTPLMLASHNGHVDVIDYLMEFHADMFLTNNQGLTAGQQARTPAEVRAAQAGPRTLEEGIDLEHHEDLAVMVTDEDTGEVDWSKIVAIACKKGKIGVVQFVLSKADLPKTFDDGSTPLMLASSYGHTDLVRYLLEQGADLHDIDNKGQTVTMQACKQGRMEIFKLLVAKGANLLATDNDGNTPLILASVSENAALVKYLLEQGAGLDETNKEGKTATLQACLAGRLGSVRILVEEGADLNAQDEEGNTALILASASNNADLVRYLLARGARLRETNNEGRTATLQACLVGCLEIVQLLEQKGGDLNATDNEGNTALMLAAMCPCSERLMQYLLVKGANVRAIDENGRTASMKACEAGLNDNVKFLKQKGANLGATDDAGNTHLILASASADCILVLYLIHEGADVHLANKDGRTAIMQACNAGRLLNFTFLAEKGASLSAADNDGNTPLALARRGEARAMEEMFDRVQDFGQIIDRIESQGIVD